MSTTKTAAFFRAEGVVIETGVVASAAYMAANRAGLRERAFRFGQAALAAPIYGLLGQNDRTLGNRVAHLSYRDMTEDRIVVLAEEYVEDILKDRILNRGVELMRKAKKQGHQVVLLSENIEQIIHPLAEHLRVVDQTVCNRLEFRDGLATGRLREPIIGGHDGGRWLEAYASEHQIDLPNSVAYAAHGPDLLLLAEVGGACAVNPDYTLRRAAKEADWPVIEYRE